MKNYDVIIIGSGLGGLSAAALLAKTGKKILVLERHKIPGGNAQAFKRKNYLFDSAVHLAGGCIDGGIDTTGLASLLLQSLGVSKHCEFIKVDPFYAAVFPDDRISAPLGLENFIRAHVEQFPEEKNGFESFMKLCAEIHQEAFLLDQFTFKELSKLNASHPKLAKYRNATLADVLDEFLNDRRLKSMCSALWLYLGLPPSRVSFLWWANMLISYVMEGAAYCKGSFQNLANGFVESLRANGGEILFSKEVEKILIENNKTRGVKLSDGEKIFADTVVSNCDAIKTFENLVGYENLPEWFSADLQTMKPSLSGFVVYLATDLDVKALGASHEMFFYNDYDHEKIYNEQLSEFSENCLAVTIPTLIDPSLAPEGEHLVTLMKLVSYDASKKWKEEKEKFANKMLEEAEKILPGLSGKIKYIECASPDTFERYTLNTNGACYGWEPSPEQTGTYRLDNKTNIEGLFLTGHWTRPAGGVYGVILSGLQASRKILGYKTIGEYLRALGIGIR